MNLEEAKQKLVSAGLEIESEDRTGNDDGWRVKLTNGGIVNVFDSGKYNVQGKSQHDVKEALECQATGTSTLRAANSAEAKRKVFVVYGHDEAARTELETMLRRWGLDPLILDQLPSEGQTIIEKLEKYAAEVEFAVVLATPDDEGHRADRGDEKAFRARQNVVLELGMLLAKLGRSRVAIILKKQAKMERPSDIQGLIYIPFEENLQKEAGTILAKEMTTQGFRIEVANL